MIFGPSHHFRSQLTGVLLCDAICDQFGEWMRNCGERAKLDYFVRYIVLGFFSEGSSWRNNYSYLNTNSNPCDKTTIFSKPK